MEDGFKIKRSPTTQQTWPNYEIPVTLNKEENHDSLHYNMKQLSRKNITEPDKNGYQVRVVRRGIETSRYFSKRLWGGEKKALQAANNWRDQVCMVRKCHTRRLDYPCKNNLSTGVLGVCRTHHYDKRKNNTCLLYGVSWVDHKGTKRGKSFRVCNVLTYDPVRDLLAFQQAIKFRKEWEHHADNDTLHEFNPDSYLNWRNERIDNSLTMTELDKMLNVKDDE
jgi:hypothetical protein